MKVTYFEPHEKNDLGGREKEGHARETGEFLWPSFFSGKVDVILLKPQYGEGMGNIAQNKCLESPFCVQRTWTVEFGGFGLFLANASGRYNCCKTNL